MKLGLWSIALLILVLALARFWAGAALPLSADEAYYWLWSRHLAWGYYDHPPLIAYAIAFGTSLFGDTPLGVRLVGLLGSLASAFAIWRAAQLLFKDKVLEYPNLGALACLFFSLTPMVAIQSMAATPDTLSITAASFFLLALAKVEQSGRGHWWLAAGVAAGLGLLAKYTILFLGLGALLWLLVDARQRHWLWTVWPYLGGLVAVLIFVPNLLWNFQNDWQTIKFQFGRVSDGALTYRYIAEFLGAQIGLATPFIFLLAIMGLVPRRDESYLAQMLIWPSIAYFLIHALHDRVQGNWPSFLYPVFALTALAAVLRVNWQGWKLKLIQISKHAAIPVAVSLMLFLYLQAFTAVLPLGRGDPIQRLLAFGFPDMAKDIVRTVSSHRARIIVTTDYAMTAWLRFYLPSDLPVIQLNEPARWDMVESSIALPTKALYITSPRRDHADAMRVWFESAEPCATFERRRSGVVIESFGGYCLHGPKIKNGKSP